MMSEKNKDLKKRTKEFSLLMIHIFSLLPKTAEAQVLGRQLLRSGTSVGAHYREATRARSTAEVISKIEVGLQELEESAYWLELIIEAKLLAPEYMEGILKEVEELTAILVTSVKTAKKRRY
jgi:four helix bundle protein